MSITERDKEADSPRLHVSFLGREYAGAAGAKSFSVTSTFTNIFDGWTLDLPIGAIGGVNEDIPGLNLHRWIPIKLAHADPRVDNGKPIPLLQGVCTRVDHITSDQASVLRLTGYDLGKVLDSCVLPWIRLRGLKMDSLVEKLLDPSWLAKNRSDGWGIQGPIYTNTNRNTKRGNRISLGRQQAQIDIGKAKYGTIIPPIQTEVGETVYDIISRYARLSGITSSSGSFVNCSADGYVQIFNPDDFKNDPPQYVFEDHADDRNFRVKASTLALDGEDLYSEYRCYSSVIAPPQQIAFDTITNPNAGRIKGIDDADKNILGTEKNRLFRRLTFADAEQYRVDFAKIRAQWRRRQSLYREFAVNLTVQGHSMPDPDGQWRPIVEGNVAELRSSRLHINGRFLIEKVTKRQDAVTGTVCDIVLRKLGLLGA